MSTLTTKTIDYLYDHNSTTLQLPHDQLLHTPSSWLQYTTTTTIAPSVGANTTNVNIAAKPWDMFKHQTPMVVILTVAYVTVLTMGIINNSLVLCAIYRNQSLRTVTNIFLANLAVADLFVCIFVLPITLLHNLFTEWHFSAVVCKAMPYMQGVSVNASANTMAAVAVERYLEIFYPKTVRMTPRLARWLIALIWILPLLLFIPWIYVFTLDPIPMRKHYTFLFCHPVWSNKDAQRLYNLGVILTCYFIPLIFIAICYLCIGLRVWRRNVAGMKGTRCERNIQRAKIRIVRMLVAVFLTFTFCFLLLYSIQLRTLYGGNMSSKEKFIRQRYLQPLAQWLGAVNSCANPFIYCYFSSNFRKSIVTVLKSGSCSSKVSL